MLAPLLGWIRSNYALQLPCCHYKLEAFLLIQSMSSLYVADLLEVDTPEVKAGLYSKANLAPEVISTAISNLDVP
jgi:hypothetical protein